MWPQLNSKEGDKENASNINMAKKMIKMKKRMQCVRLNKAEEEEEKVAWRILLNIIALKAVMRDKDLNINPGFCLQKIREITVCSDMGITADTASVSENERERVCVCVSQTSDDLCQHFMSSKGSYNEQLLYASGT